MPPANGTAAVAVVGAGIAGIATAYFLAVDHGIANVVLVDAGEPLGFTSARSGDNYRNCWPHPVMAAFTNRSIDLMERIARRTGNRIAMTRRGYAVATREPGIDELVEQLKFGYGDAAGRFLRIHSGAKCAGIPASLVARLGRRTERRGHPAQRAPDQGDLPLLHWIHTSPRSSADDVALEVETRRALSRDGAEGRAPTEWGVAGTYLELRIAPRPLERCSQGPLFMSRPRDRPVDCAQGL